MNHDLEYCAQVLFAVLVVFGIFSKCSIYLFYMFTSLVFCGVDTFVITSMVIVTLPTLRNNNNYGNATNKLHVAQLMCAFCSMTSYLCWFFVGKKITPMMYLMVFAQTCGMAILLLNIWYSLLYVVRLIYLFSQSSIHNNDDNLNSIPISIAIEIPNDVVIVEHSSVITQQQ